MCGSNVAGGGTTGSSAGEQTLGLTIAEVHDGCRRASLSVTREVSNVIGALHSNGVAALADAAALAAVLKPVTAGALNSAADWADDAPA